MNRKDRLAAEDLLREYRLHLGHARGEYNFNNYDPAEALEAANKMLPRVNAIMCAQVPDTAPISGSSLEDHEAGLLRVERAEDILGDWDGMTENDGETVQWVIPLNALDLVVHDAVAQNWRHGQYRQAVENAAGKLNKFTQDWLDRHDISDSDLMTQAFSPNRPKDGAPRLRCPGNPESEIVRAMQEGAMHFAKGAMMAIRNPAVHWTGNGNPASASEQLAALSVVARWVRYWDVVKYSPPTA
ncbi:MAG TPA: TIGR02391 family protein [Streptosporangiaceae bacterium]|nr:TIGR02391 family protein [Streptosporangiaceae bacterium]